MYLLDDCLTWVAYTYATRTKTMTGSLKSSYLYCSSNNYITVVKQQEKSLANRKCEIPQPVPSRVS